MHAALMLHESPIRSSHDQKEPHEFHMLHPKAKPYFDRLNYEQLTINHCFMKLITKYQ